MTKKPIIVVTGAAGFLGGRMAKHLSLTGIGNIYATSRRSDRKMELEHAGCQFLAGDLLNPNHCATLVAGADVVVHCAALSAPWGRYADFYEANVIATQQLLSAAQHAGVGRFVYISTPSIYCNYSSRLSINEDAPLPSKSINAYAATKYLAEQYVLKNNKQKIHTIALRPRAIIGAEDTVIFPRVVHAYKSGRLKIIGDGNNICDLTSALNVIQAVKCCLNADDIAMGLAYNITNDDPIPFWDALKYVFKELDMKPPEQKIPRSIAMAVAYLSELIAILKKAQQEPALTRYGVAVLADSMTLDITRAQEFLGYQPIQNTLEGLKEFTQWYQQQQ